MLEGHFILRLNRDLRQTTNIIAERCLRVYGIQFTKSNFKRKSSAHRTLFCSQNRSKCKSYSLWWCAWSIWPQPFVITHITRHQNNNYSVKWLLVKSVNNTKHVGVFLSRRVKWFSHSLPWVFEFIVDNGHWSIQLRIYNINLPLAGTERGYAVRSSLLRPGHLACEQQQ